MTQPQKSMGGVVKMRFSETDDRKGWLSTPAKTKRAEDNSRYLKADEPSGYMEGFVVQLKNVICGRVVKSDREGESSQW